MISVVTKSEVVEKYKITLASALDKVTILQRTHYIHLSNKQQVFNETALIKLNDVFKKSRISMKLFAYQVDVGIVPSRRTGTQERSQLEIDFVANLGSRRYYIQSACGYRMWRRRTGKSVFTEGKRFF